MSNAVLITGATSGIGHAAAVQFAEAGHAVTLTGRTGDRAAAAARGIAEQTGRPHVGSVALDLGDPSGIEQAAGELVGSRFDALVLNAGMLSPADRRFTDDGIELTFASSLIGHHRLVMALLADGGLAEGARIVIAGSEAARGDVPMMSLADLDQLAAEHHDGDLSAAAVDLIRGVQPTKFKPNDTYGTAKLFVAWWAAALDRRLPESMTAMAVSPGSTPDTQAGRNANFLTRKVMLPMLKLMPKSMNMAATAGDAAARYAEALALPSTDAAGSFYASKPKKMSGPLHRMSYPHIDRLDHQEAAWQAIVQIAGVGLPD